MLQCTKSENGQQLLTIINYIHQNPLRKGLVKKLDECEFSSYLDYARKRKGTLVDKSFVESKFNSGENFVYFSSEKVEKFDFIYK